MRIKELWPDAARRMSPGGDLLIVFALHGEN
jgi:hypothetical protein